MGDSLHRFTMPLFDPKGFKICDIFGQKATVIDPNRYRVTDISITTPHQQSTFPDFSIISDQADINVQKNEIFGDGFIAISNPLFSATGKRWCLEGNNKNFTLNENVQVFFENNPTLKE